jgi:transcriptional regulator with PAS, ATPase and Fis domain
VIGEMSPLCQSSVLACLTPSLRANFSATSKAPSLARQRTRPGLVAAAENGTLFLDEIGDIPMADQVKLLRLLETRRYRQFGSNEWVEADFRMVCATNKDLAAMVELGKFREDLFYRINVFEIVLPPLRERKVTARNSQRN